MNRENKPLFLYTFITVFGGLIVGLNMAGISGAVPFLQEQFMLDDMALGLLSDMYQSIQFLRMRH